MIETIVTTLTLDLTSNLIYNRFFSSNKDLKAFLNQLLGEIQEKFEVVHKMYIDTVKFQNFVNKNENETLYILVKILLDRNEDKDVTKFIDTMCNEGFFYMKSEEKQKKILLFFLKQLSELMIRKAIDNSSIPGKILIQLLVEFLTDRESIIRFLSPQSKKLNPSFTQTKYDISNYVQRTLFRITSIEESDQYISTNYYLYQILQFEKSILLLGQAGIGKSYELKKAVNDLLENKTFSPYFFELFKYNGQEIQTLFPEYLIENENLILLLDGYDEIDDNKKTEFKRNLILFRENFPSIGIIISSRTNIDPQLGWCKSYFLKELDDNFVKTQLEKLGKYNLSFNGIKSANILSLLKIPFYLESLKVLFQEKHIIPNTRYEFFNYLITRQLEIDDNKSIYTDNLRQFKIFELENILYKIGFFIKVSRNVLAKESDLVQVINKDELQAIRHCGLLNVSNDSNPIWQFTHSLFLEYCAAKYLGQFEFSKIKKIICFKPNHNILIPSWLNTLEFIIDNWIQIDDKIIIDISELSFEAVLKIELQSISQKARHIVFYEIFNYYNEKGIRISTEILKDLAIFANNNLIIIELFEQAKNEKNTIWLINFAEIAKYFNYPHLDKQKYKRTLFDIFLSSNDHIIIYELIYALKPVLEDEEDYRNIYNKVLNIDNNMIRAAFYSVLEESKYVDNFIIFLVNGLKHLVWKVNTSQDNIKVRLIDEGYYLEACLVKLGTVDSIKILISHFIKNPEEITNIKFNNFIELLTLNLAKIFKTNIEIFEYCLNFFVFLNRVYLGPEASKFVLFFNETGTINQAVDYIVCKKDDNSHRFASLALLYNSSFEIKPFVKAYLNGMLSKNDLSLINNFVNSNIKMKNELDNFLKSINAELEEKIDIPVRINYEEVKVQSFDIKLKSIINKSFFLKMISDVYLLIGKEKINKDDISNLIINNHVFYEINAFIIYNLEILLKDKPKSISEIYQIINSSYWENFQIINIYRFHKYENIKLSDEIKEIIHNWCASNVEKINFSSSIETKRNGAISFKQDAVLLWYFIIHNFYKCTEEKFLEMLLFDFPAEDGYVGFKFIIENVEFLKIKDRIKLNMEKGIYVEIIWENHLNFCIQNNVVESVKYAFNIISNTSYSIDLRKVALDCILLFENNVSTVKYLVETITDNFKWELYKRVLAYRDLLITPLTSLLNHRINDEIYRVVELMIELKQIEGLNFIYNELSTFMLVPDFFIYNVHFDRVDFKDALPVLYKIIELTFHKDFKDHQLFPLKDKIFTSFSKIIQQHDILDEVVMNLENIILKNNDLKESKVNINYYIENIKSTYYTSKNINTDFQEANRILGSKI